MVASIESFRKKTPSPVTIETVEPSIIWWTSKKDVDRIIEEIKETAPLRDTFINGIFERTFDYIKHFVSFIRAIEKTGDIDVPNGKRLVVVI